MNAPPDIVTDFMRILHQLDPQRPRTELWSLERQVRDQFGGRRYYVRKAETVERERQKSSRNASSS